MDHQLADNWPWGQAGFRGREFQKLEQSVEYVQKCNAPKYQCISTFTVYILWLEHFPFQFPPVTFSPTLALLLPLHGLYAVHQSVEGEGLPHERETQEGIRSTKPKACIYCARLRR